LREAGAIRIYWAGVRVGRTRGGGAESRATALAGPDWNSMVGLEGWVRAFCQVGLGPDYWGVW
jgi:hypothetical protein